MFENLMKIEVSVASFIAQPRLHIFQASVFDFLISGDSSNPFFRHQQKMAMACVYLHNMCSAYCVKHFTDLVTTAMCV